MFSVLLMCLPHVVLILFKLIMYETYTSYVLPFIHEMLVYFQSPNFPYGWRLSQWVLSAHSTLQ